MSQGFKSLRRTDNEIIVVPESGIRIEQVILTVMRHIPVDISACTTVPEHFMRIGRQGKIPAAADPFGLQPLKLVRTRKCDTVSEDRHFASSKAGRCLMVENDKMRLRSEGTADQNLVSRKRTGFAVRTTISRHALLPPAGAVRIIGVEDRRVHLRYGKALILRLFQRQVQTVGKRLIVLANEVVAGGGRRSQPNPASSEPASRQKITQSPETK